MTDTQKQSYVAWLNDAHALELTLVTALEKQISDAEGMPALQTRLTEHLEETKMHASKVESCLERHNESVSTAKDLMGKATAAISGLGLNLNSDVMVKNMHSTYASEQAEIASYTTIMAAAQILGDTETATICEEILKDEYAMADWAREQIPVVVAEHLSAQKD